MNILMSENSFITSTKNSQQYHKLIMASNFNPIHINEEKQWRKKYFLLTTFVQFLSKNVPQNVPRMWHPFMQNKSKHYNFLKRYKH